MALAVTLEALTWERRVQYIGKPARSADWRVVLLPTDSFSEVFH
jgi:hypothetical protein